MKKTLAIILSVLMILCMMPSMAFADSETPLAEAKITLTNTNYTYTGGQITPSISVTLSEAPISSGYVVEYTKKDTVSYSTTAPTNAGTYLLRIKGDGTNYSTAASTQTVEFTINPMNLSAVNMQDITPQPIGQGLDASKVVLSYTLNGQIKYLTKDTDYTISSSVTKSGINKVTVTGTGNFTGSKEKEYAGGVDINASYNLSFTNPSNLTYSGSAKTCTNIQVTPNSSGNNLVENTDYIVSYKNNINAGNATIVITGMGNYAGTIERNFIIDPKPITQCTVDAIPNATSAEDVAPVVRDGSKILVKGTDYFTAVDFDNKVVTITGKGNYTGSVPKTFKTGTAISSAIIRVNGITQTSGQTDTGIKYTYNGSVQKPTIELYYPTYTTANKLVENRDYTLTWENTTNASNTSLTSYKPAKVTITGINTYAGKIERTYTINPKTISQSTCRLSLSGSMAYIPMGNYSSTASTKYMPEFTLYDSNGKALVRGTDYYVSSYDYTNTTTKSAVNISLIGKGNYTGSYYGNNVVLNGINMAYCTVQLAGTSYKYTGSAITPAVTVYYGSTKLSSSYYIVSYKNNKDIGTATVTVTGTNGYTGSQSVNFSITGNTIESCTTTLSQTSYNYDGNTKRPTVTVKDGYTTLRENTDYTLTYANNRVAGTATVTIKGIGKYSGTVVKEFSIVGLEQTLTTRYTRYTKYTTSSNFNLGAAATGDGTGFTYTSSDTSVVKVSTAGEVQVVGTGIATITVATRGTTRYNPASKVVTVKVKPIKPLVSVSSPEYRQIKVDITKVEGATKYQVRYGRNGKYYNKYVTHTDNGYATTSVTLRNRQSGTNYFIKVRAYKTMANGEKVWGNWTKVKKVRSL